MIFSRGRVDSLRSHCSRPANYKKQAAQFLFACQLDSTSCGVRTYAASVNQSSEQAVSPAEVQFWDVVEYVPAQQVQANITRLGLVQQITPDCVKVAPLIEESEGQWISDDNIEEQQIPVANVVQVVEHLFSQVQDTEHNPHGEHAHDVWQVLSPLPKNVFRG